ncbi:hypothetical protein MUK42_37266 [Musa troglodytarum]|uniref:Cystatin domain-containing protein n=1 Tax=Musa troglodytarum TaxID=320322 RepID=A0A9E7JVF5_9LILI|nr:hypothetical protein MUK42_37266 [Musa troglodytarum]
MSRILAVLLLLRLDLSCSPIRDLDDPHAVSQYNVQENKGLELSRVPTGQQQVVSGMNYNVALQVKDGLSTAKCVAVVYESLKGEKVLKSFVLIREIIGGWTPIDVNNPHVHDIAVFAVSERNKEARWSMSFHHLVRGYRLG